MHVGHITEVIIGERRTLVREVVHADSDSALDTGDIEAIVEKIKPTR